MTIKEAAIVAMKTGLSRSLSSIRSNTLCWELDRCGTEIQMSINKTGDLYIGLIYEAEILSDGNEEIEKRLENVPMQYAIDTINRLKRKAKNDECLAEAAADAEAFGE